MSATAPSAASQATLSAYYWHLASAVDASGKPIAALQKGIDNRLRLSFTEQGLSITGGCNTQFGGYRYDKGVLQVAQLAATMKACEPA